MYFTLQQDPFFLFCQPKRCVAVTIAPHFCSCNLVCGSSPSPVMDLFGSFFCPYEMGCFLSEGAQETAVNKSGCILLLGCQQLHVIWMDCFCALVFLFDLCLIIIELITAFLRSVHEKHSVVECGSAQHTDMKMWV